MREVKAHRHSSVDSDRAHSRCTGQVGYARAGPRGDHNHCLDRYSGSIRRRFHSPEPLRGPRYNADKPRVHTHSDPWRDNPAGHLPADHTPGGIANTKRIGYIRERRSMSEERSQQSSPLQTERGSTSISDSVVSKIAGIASQEVDGVRMGSGGSQAVSGILGTITGGSSGFQSQGVSVEVGEKEAALDLTLTQQDGKTIPQVGEAAKRNMANRVES